MPKPKPKIVHHKIPKDDRPPIIFIPADYALDATGIIAMAEIFGRGAIMVTDTPLYNRVRIGVEDALNTGGPGVHKVVGKEND